MTSRAADTEHGTRDELVSRLVEVVGSVTVVHPTRVAVDGPPAAGKTTLADELAVVLRAQGRAVIRASIESFLLPQSERYRRGVYSGEGCYHDSFDYDALRRVLLQPLGPGGDRRFQPAVYDKSTDTALSPPIATAPSDAVLLFEGVFLLRPELIDRWDLRIYVSVAFEETLDRARTRDLAAYGSATEVEHRFRDRYLPSQRLYLDAGRPTEHADVIVHNDEPEQPTWEVRRPLDVLPRNRWQSVQRSLVPAGGRRVATGSVEEESFGVLDDDMKRVVTEQRLGYLASVCPDGTPNLSPKGTIAVWDDQHLVFAHLHSAQTVANIEAGNDVVEVNVVDPIARKGYRFKGRASVHRDGPTYDQGANFYENRSGLEARRIQALVLIEVGHAAPLISPGYDDGSTEAEVEARSLKMYGLVHAPQSDD